jgi:membrane protease YdiL (CAAX protease family)
MAEKDEQAGERPPYLRFLPRFLFAADRPVSYVLKAWLLALLPSIVLSAVIGSLVPDAERPALSAETWPMIALIVAVAPFLETLILAAMLSLFVRLNSPGAAVVLAALLWGVAHSLEAPTWGLVVWWPFLVMSVAFLTWRKRGLWTAIGLVTLIHAMQNSVGVVMLILQG